MKSPYNNNNSLQVNGMSNSYESTYTYMHKRIGKKNKDMKRDAGFYWVKFKDHWTIAVYYGGELVGDSWHIIAHRETVKESELQEIDEVRILRRELA